MLLKAVLVVAMLLTAATTLKILGMQGNTSIKRQAVNK
jgi:hypothetical protein